MCFRRVRYKLAFRESEAYVEVVIHTEGTCYAVMRILLNAVSKIEVGFFQKRKKD